MKVKQLLNVARGSLEDPEFKIFFNSITVGTNDYIGISQSNYDVAKNSALESVYHGDCDQVIFSHYRLALDLLEAVTEYDNDQ